MIAILLLMNAAVEDDGAISFKAGPWEGRCAQYKEAQCTAYEAEYAGPVALRFKRDASTISIIVQPKDCKSVQSVGKINPV